MSKIIDYLEQLELSDIEAKLYLTLLETGPISVRDLAEAVAIKRTTTYLYIAKLIEKELIVKIVKGSHKMIAANDPKVSLEYLVKKKLENANTIESEFPDMLNIISTTLPQIKDVGEAEIKYYKGENAVQKIYEEALQANELRSYAKLEETGGIFADNVSFFNNAFKKNKKLKVKEILYNSPLSKEQAPQLLSKYVQYSYKFMPKELRLTSGDTLIYDGKVAIINYKNKVSSVVLHSSDYYNNSKELFEFIWKMLP